jgi:membrane protease YdiL (CAAX protease family)
MSAGLIGTYLGLKDQSFMSQVPALIQTKLIGFGVDTPIKYLALAVFISAIHSFLEEYYWRWYVYRELNHWIGHTKAVVFSALAFTGHHVIVVKAYLPPEIQSWGIWVFPAFVFVAGVVWSISYGKFQSLWPNWVSHLMADVAILWIGYRLVWPA